MNIVGGRVESGFERVREAFEEGQASDEGGAQLCVYQHGRQVVNLWIGQDVIRQRPYAEDTITVMMSCTKAAVAVCAHILAERGELDFDAPVARYWPEFAAGGKRNVRVRHLLTHSAGLMGYEPESGIGANELLDWQTATDGLARMEPLWEPGTAYFYHFVTFGFLVGEVIRRISRKSVGRFFADEIAGPLKIDMWIGLPEAEEHRVAPHFSRLAAISEEQWRTLLGGAGIDLTTRLARTVLYTFKTTDEAVFGLMNSRPGHAVEIPAGNGIGNARALARIYASLISEVDGVRLLRPETMERARTPQTKGIGAPGDFARFARTEPQWFGLGFELPRAAEPMFGPGSFGHAGAGGRMGFVHPESGIAVGYVCNNMMWNNLEPDARWVPWTKALHDAVDARG
jgi:CubicO group peptidase (beta-lactamase class C family)